MIMCYSAAGTRSRATSRPCSTTSARRSPVSPGRRRRDAPPAANRIDDENYEMTDNRNTILAVILSGLVLIAWQYFYNVPQMERQRAQSQMQAELQKGAP